MKFKLDSPPYDNPNKIDYKSKIVLLGSCFSDEIASKLKLAGFNSLSNPFGTIFHPIPLANCIKQSLSGKPHFDFLIKDEYCSCWDASHQLQAQNQSAMNQLIIEKSRNLRQSLEQASHLFITLGSSWAYIEKGLNKVVANCHKENAKRFEKKLSSIDEMYAIWQHVLKSLRDLNPKLKICFTISPVRHSKDGLVENNRSKARLFELLTRLETENDLGYFPAYEIVLDELRDYRFYGSDLVHPSEAAIDYVWDKWLDAFCIEQTKAIVGQTERLRALAAHKIMHPDTAEAKRFELDREKKIQSFLAANPSVVW